LVKEVSLPRPTTGQTDTPSNRKLDEAFFAAFAATAHGPPDDPPDDCDNPPSRQFRVVAVDTLGGAAASEGVVA